jgi:hypothetical protein
MSNSVQSVGDLSEFAEGMKLRGDHHSPQEIMSSMSATPTTTDSFSAQRREILQDFANVTMTADAGKIADLWLHHYSSLTGARGLFCVKEQRYDKPDLPENRDFGGRGFLRSWMASKRLLLIQNCERARDRRYSAPIFCDSNFVSYCEAFCGQRSLSQNSDAFRDAVAYLLPRAEGTSAFPYMVENAENPDREKVRATLRAFAAFKLTSPEYFASHGRFLTARGKLTADDIADGCLEVMGKADFRTLHTWVKDHYLWSRIVLIKAALLFFEGRCKETPTLFFELLKFLHDELARLPQFEIYVAHRFFLLSSREPFFSPVQQNAMDLDRKIRSMAWDLAHWRSLFEMLAIGASFVGATPFPIPHFLSFDRPFVKLTEAFQLSGLIYAANGRLCEHIYSEALWRPVSDLLGEERRQLCTKEAIRDRQRRNQNDGAPDGRLVQSEATLKGLLNQAFGRSEGA